jgi:hypothetical protein
MMHGQQNVKKSFAYALGGRWEQGQIKNFKKAFCEILQYTGLLISFCNSQTDSAGRESRSQNAYLLRIYAVRSGSSLGRFEW